MALYSTRIKWALPKSIEIARGRTGLYPSSRRLSAVPPWYRKVAMSQSSSAMTISSSTSHGIAPATEKVESAMPRKPNDQWSEGSSAGGSRGGVEFLHEGIKKFDEQSRGSGSMNEDFAK